MNKNIFLLLLLAFFFGCGITKKIDQRVTDSPVFRKSFTGFVLFDPETGKTLYSKDGDKYFTPASNTKILTLYTSLQVLGDSVPALRYAVKGDSLIFSGTGSPTFLHPFLARDSVYSFLKNSGKDLYYLPENYTGERYGPGWAWDDFPYYYQPEKSGFPIFGNVVLFTSIGDSLHVEPPYFKAFTETVTDANIVHMAVKRDELKNYFEVTMNPDSKDTIVKEVPFRYSRDLLLRLLADTLGRSVHTSDEKMDMGLWYGLPVDSVYRRLMHKSDNFIAEQLLLMDGEILFHNQDTKQTIEYAKTHFFDDLPDELIWVDGSGLSRYNLFTPRSLVAVLNKLYHELPRERLFAIFPAGGYSGTIKDWYDMDGKPIVYAKTGTLSNKHCLSGYLLTKSGKTLIFSFMHNNYTTGSKPLKKEMEKMLLWLYEKM